MPRALWDSWFSSNSVRIAISVRALLAREQNNAPAARAAPARHRRHDPGAGPVIYQQSGGHTVRKPGLTEQKTVACGGSDSAKTTIWGGLTLVKERAAHDDGPNSASIVVSPHRVG